MAQLALEIRRRRKAAGLSHSQLAQRVGYTRQYMSLAERAGRNLPSKELVRTLDTALGADGALVALRVRADAEQKALRQQLSGSRYRARRNNGEVGRAVAGDRQAERDSTSDTILAQLPVLRRALDAYDVPEDGPVRTIDELRPVIASVVDKRLRSDYTVLAVEVPALLSELHRALVDCPAGDRPRFARLLFQVYRAADAVADKYSYYDLSARIIGLLSGIAVKAEDELVEASSSYVRGETFFASGDLAAGRKMLERAADRVRVTDSEVAAATYGTLHMRAAVMAGRAGQARWAQEHIDEAQQIAQRVNEGIHLGTAFGAASVRIHRLSLMVELGDVGAALRSAAAWQPPASLPAERRSHFCIDLGRAYHLAGQPERTLEALHAARRIAPEHVRAHPHVEEIVEQIRLTS